MTVPRSPLVARRAASAALLGALVGCAPGEHAPGPEPSGRASARFALGDPCTDEGAAGEAGAGSGCDSGHCVDGVCCDTACDSPCEACAAGAKESLGGDGTCGPARAGTDPHDDCDASVPATCGQTGYCDGRGACGLYPSGTACGATSCTGNSVDGPVCSGDGACQDPASLVPCAPYVCAGDECRTPCGSDDDCFESSAHCENGICRAKRTRGQPCTAGSECASTFCSDGVCCNTVCTGQCAACDLAGKVGTCTAVTGAPVAPRRACDGEGDCRGTCDGSSLMSCTFPSSATECAAATCTGGSARGAGHCDGTGQCELGEVDDCGLYACAGGACRTSCRVTSDCATGATCGSGDECVPVLEATCRDAFTLEEPGGALTSCEPYRCSAGTCRSRCAADSDCAGEHECVGSRCVVPSANEGGAAGTMTVPRSGAGGAGGGAGSTAAVAGRGSHPPATDISSGCGCRVGSSRAPRGGESALSLLLAVFWLRRKGCSKRADRRS